MRKCDVLKQQIIEAEKFKKEIMKEFTNYSTEEIYNIKEGLKEIQDYLDEELKERDRQKFNKLIQKIKDDFSELQETFPDASICFDYDGDEIDILRYYNLGAFDFYNN